MLARTSEMFVYQPAKFGFSRDFGIGDKAKNVCHMLVREVDWDHCSSRRDIKANGFLVIVELRTFIIKSHFDEVLSTIREKLYDIGYPMNFIFSSIWNLINPSNEAILAQWLRQTDDCEVLYFSGANNTVAKSK